MVRYLDSGLLLLVPVNTNTNKKACFNPVMNIHEPCSGAPFPTTPFLTEIPARDMSIVSFPGYHFGK